MWSLLLPIAKKVITPSKQALKGVEYENKLAESAEALSRERAGMLRGEEVWTNKDGREVKILSDWTSSRRNDKVLELQDIKTEEKFSKQKQ